MKIRLLRVVVFDFESSSSKKSEYRVKYCHFVKIGLDTKIVQSLPWNCVLSLYLIEMESVE